MDDEYQGRGSTAPSHNVKNNRPGRLAAGSRRRPGGHPDSASTFGMQRAGAGRRGPGSRDQRLKPDMLGAPTSPSGRDGDGGDSEGERSHDPVYYQFRELIEGLRQRDVVKNIARVKKEVAQYQTNTNEAAAQARQGHYQLNKRRTHIQPEDLGCTNEIDLMNLHALNDYLNGYTEKLSRADPRGGSEIKLDKWNYSQVRKAAQKATQNPYFLESTLRRQAQAMNKEIQQSENPRYMTQHLKAQLEIKEEREVQEEMEKIQKEYQPDYKHIKHKYMKGVDISNIRNYRAMIQKLTAKACAN